MRKLNMFQKLHLVLHIIKLILISNLTKSCSHTHDSKKSIYTFPMRKYTRDSLGTICFNCSNSVKASWKKKPKTNNKRTCKYRIHKTKITTDLYTVFCSIIWQWKIHTLCLSLEKRIEALWNLHSGFLGSMEIALFRVISAFSDFCCACWTCN